MTLSTCLKATPENGDPPPLPLAELLAELPRPERRRFTATWRFAREAFAIVDQVIRRPLPGADQAEQAELLLSFLIWRLRLVRREVRRARLVGYMAVV